MVLSACPSGRGVDKQARVAMGLADLMWSAANIGRSVVYWIRG